MKRISQAVLLALLAAQITGCAHVPSTCSTDSEEEKRYHPWVVVGTVTDLHGKPLEGVRIEAHCGNGTLLKMAEATTSDKGRYLIRFASGMGRSPGEVQEPQGVFALITASKAGWLGGDTDRHGLLWVMTEKPIEPDSTLLPVDCPLVLPHQPYTLNFTMKPAIGD